jgi:peptidoglycan/LPS O-acetylase OafA/YrhL
MTAQSLLLSIVGKTSPLTKRASAHLDMIRGVAALAVMFGHIRGLFFQDYKDVTGRSPMLAVLYAITGLGHQAVMVFFVLSGFLIGGSVLMGLKRWSWKRYLVNRFCRLYLVLIPALLVTAVLDYISYRQPGGHFYFDAPIAHFSREPLVAGRTLIAFLGNLAFLQHILVPVFGSNSPLWSLANEFWYYLLFPAALLVVYSPGNPKRRIAALAIVAILVAFLPGGIVLQWILGRPGGMLQAFLIWLMGVAVFVAPPVSVNRVTRRGLHLLTAGIFVGTLMLSRVQRIPTDLTDPVIGLAFALWLYCIVRIKTSPTEINFLYVWWAQLFSKCSYSLYAVHFPMVLLIRCSLGTSVWTPNLRNLTLGGGLSVVIFLFGYLFSRLTEAHNDTVRARILTIGAKAPAAQVASVG